jgi:exonuclease III
VLLVRGEILEETSLRSATEWVDAELTHFATNLPLYRIRTSTIPELMVVNVYSPAWPVDRGRLQGHDLAAVKLKQNPDVWVTDLLVAALQEYLPSPRAEWLIAGDFNSCESFDEWKGGPRGNREWLDRMAALGLRECLRQHQGALTPTFRRPGAVLAKSQIDHIFATSGLTKQLAACSVGAASVVYDQGFSDHLPIIADFRNDAPAA